MFGWLRDALASAPTSFNNRHVHTPSVFRQQKQKHHEQISSDDDDINQSNDNSFYHNPYHSSGQMNYADVPQQQYTNEHTYPTYLARQQTSNIENQTLDHQIQTKLISLHQRPTQLDCYSHRQHNYAYRNRTLPIPVLPATTRSSFTSNRNEECRNSNEERSDDDEEEDDKEEEEEGEGDVDDDDVNDDDDERSSLTEPYHGVPGYYSGQYSHIDEQFDLASVVLCPNNIHDERNEYNNHHYSLSSKNPILSRNLNENNRLLNNENENEHSNILLSSSKVKWIDAVRTVTQLNQVRNKC
ncbi:unnamed protein product [Adineta steineri]|uniref:Uncharacterized protein n=1 Tax=Adineta steineri TaxID=433720 RepID=A0A818G4N7_9BILA|nr:unnamed protein product [Adineta steineri]CAF3484090.1 unnamed protein product [Adineta steineri]